VTRRGDEVTERGRYFIDGRSKPAVLETWGVHYFRLVHRAGSTEFADCRGPTRARLLVRGNQLRLCASTKPGVLPDDLRTASADIYLATFTQLESIMRKSA
jgi:hypothetical protein